MNITSRWQSVAAGALLMAGLIQPSFGQVVSEEQIKKSLIALNAQGKYDQAISKLRAYVKDESDPNAVVFYYVEDLSQVRHQHERAIQVVDLLASAVAAGDQAYAGHILKEKAHSILFGRFGRTHKEADLAMGRDTLIAALRLNPRMTQAYMQLGIVMAIDGEAPTAKDCFKTAIKFSGEPTLTSAMRNWIANLDKDPNAFCASMKVFFDPR